MSQFEQLALLYELQKIDWQIQVLEQKRKQIPKRLKTFDTRLGKYEEQARSKRSELAEISKDQRSLEGKLKLQKNNLAKYQEQLRLVKDNKSYQAVETEIDVAEVKISELEDEILEFMEEADEVKAELNSYEDELNRIKADYEDDKVEFKKIVDKIDKKIVDLEEMKKPFESKIDDRLLKKYKTWREKGLFLLSPIKGNVCTGCNLTVPQQTINEVNKKEKITVCGSCGRILYIP